jgi:hypothetical protein
MFTIRFYPKLIFLIVLILLALSLIARAFGSTLPPNPALLDFVEGCEGKTYPCWYGIIPGSTTLTQAQTLLETHYGQSNTTLNGHMIDWKFETSADKSQGGYLTLTDQGIVDELTVTFLKNHLTVGEIITQFGEPSLVYVIRAFSSEVPCAGSIISYPQIGVNAYLYPVGASVGVQANQSIYSLTLLPLELAKNWSITDSIVAKWQGFKKYCAIVTQ